MDIIEAIGRKAKEIPYQYKVAFISTFIIGLIAHAFCYTNMLVWHDSAALYYEETSIAAMAGGGRWFNAIVFNSMGNTTVPWLMGIVLLTMYALTACMVCELLELRRTLPIILVSGILVTNRTVACSNLFITGAQCFGFALLMAAFGVWAYNHMKHGWIWSWIGIYLCASVYATYIDFAISLFLIQQIGYVIMGQGSVKKNIGRHFGMLFIFATAYFGTYYTDRVILALNSTAYAQERFEAVAESSVTTFQENILQAVISLIRWFAPTSSRSYFQDIKWYYGLFALIFICTLILMIYEIIANRVWKNMLSMILILVDLASLLLAMNLIDVVNVCYDLHHFAYIIPWIFFVYFQEKMIIDKSSLRMKVRSLIYQIYKSLVVIISVSAILLGCVISNTVYTKVYNEIQASANLLNRVVERVESVQGYIPGVTPVVIVGDTKKYYVKEYEGYELIKDLDVVYSPWFDSAITYSVPIDSYIRQYLRINMNLVDIQYGNFYYVLGDINQYCQNLHNRTGYYIDTEELKSLINAESIFPSPYCTRWCGEVLVIII